MRHVDIAHVILLFSYLFRENIVQYGIKEKLEP